MSDLNNAHFIDQQWNLPTAETGRSPNTPWLGWERYSINSSGKVGIGDSFDWDSTQYNNNYGIDISSMPIDSGGMGDLSSYDYYALVFHNPNLFSIDVEEV